jgi:GNAT superfamily N-acetyltransferase
MSRHGERLTRLAVLSSEAEWEQAFPVMRELRPHLNTESYLELLREMAADGYRLIALLEDDEITALGGIASRVNLYYGRYVWVYDLVTTERARSRGHGEKLLRHIEELAREEGCEMVALSSALHRTNAHRFYEEKMGYERASYTFTKDLGTVRT